MLKYILSYRLNYLRYFFDFNNLYRYVGRDFLSFLNSWFLKLYARRSFFLELRYSYLVKDEEDEEYYDNKPGGNEGP